MDSNETKRLNAKDLAQLFLKELKAYNQPNFKAIAKADLTKQDAAVHKAFSSAITRYFIFREKHPEISESEFNMLYYKLKLDLVAVYFSEFPDTTTDNLVGFQIEVKRYIKERRSKGIDDLEEGVHKNEQPQTASIPNIGLEPNNTVQIKQQPELESVAI